MTNDNTKQKLAANIPNGELDFFERLSTLGGFQRFLMSVYGIDTNLTYHADYGTFVTKGECIAWLSKNVFGGTLTTKCFNDLKKTLMA